ncbi:MAG: TonB-dependent receptor [Flavobacteriaceae bacterium]|nr:TonB-dependent receptor [Flavobacteriaceae bacterium]
MKHFISYSILFILISVSSFAQKTQLKGIVIDAVTQQKVPFATIAIYNQDKLVDGVSANENGTFQLKTSKEFTYVEVSFIGYKTKQIQASEIKNKKELTILLVVDENTLDEIIIQGERTTSQLKIDRKIFNLGSDVQQSGTTVLEAFDQIVDIQVDLGTNSLSLRGSGNVRLLVNGKPSSMGATELLEQIPSSSVDRIEIITSPSAREQADGISGIINVILKKDVNKGLNLNINSSVGTNNRYGFGFGGNYNYSFVNVRLNASRNVMNMDNEQNLIRNFSNGNIENIDALYKFKGNTDVAALGLDFFIDSKNELSFEVGYSDNSHSINSNTLSNNVIGNYVRETEHFHLTTTFNGNYRRKFNDDGHYIEFDYNLSQNNNDFPTTDYEDGSLLFNITNVYDNVLHAGAIDYVLPLNEKVKFETGASWNKRDLESIFNTELAGSSPTTDLFNYEEEVVGLYALSSLVTGKIKWQAGLRYEYFVSKSNNSENSDVFKKTIPDLFPSLHMSYTINDKNTINLGYSKRVSRPNFRHVNPFQLGGPFFRFEGNPDLQPEYSDNIELNYQNTNDAISWSIATFYRDRKDVIQQFNRIEGNSQVISFKNLGVNNSYGIEANTSFKPISFLSTVISGNYYFTKIDAVSVVTWNDTYSSNIQLKNTVKFNKRFSADITYRYMPKNQQAFNFIEPRDRIDFAVRAKFFKNKLTANLRVVDILNNNLMKNNTIASGFTQNMVWRFQGQTRNYLLSIKYKLFDNSTLKRNRKKRDYKHGGTSE